MSGYDFREYERVGEGERGRERPAPGKRTLTQSLAVQRRAAADGAPLDDRQLQRAQRVNLRMYRRHAFDPGLFGGAAIDSADFANAVARKQQQLGVRVDGIVGPQTLDAMGARRHRDGFEATRGRRDPNGAAARATPGGIDAMIDDGMPDTRATIDGKPRSEDPKEGLIDPFADDDPFGMHLIG